MIVSGGQTGADRGGLEAAKICGVPTTGWAPRRFLTEIGPDPSLSAFGLKETDTSDYPSRTEKNVRMSDACLIFGDPESRGARLTRRLCEEAAKPYLLVVSGAGSRPNEAVGWIVARARIGPESVTWIMVAGNRESKSPGIAAKTQAFMVALLTILKTC